LLIYSDPKKTKNDKMMEGLILRGQISQNRSSKFLFLVLLVTACPCFIKYLSSKIVVSHYGLAILGNVGNLKPSMKKPTTLGWYNDTGIFL